jgi:hypothetical protein
MILDPSGVPLRKKMYSSKLKQNRTTEYFIIFILENMLLMFTEIQYVKASNSNIRGKIILAVIFLNINTGIKWRSSKLKTY